MSLKQAPRDIKLKVLSYLPSEDLKSYQRVSKEEYTDVFNYWKLKAFKEGFSKEFKQECDGEKVYLRAKRKHEANRLRDLYYKLDEWRVRVGNILQDREFLENATMYVDIHYKEKKKRLREILDRLDNQEDMKSIVKELEEVTGSIVEDLNKDKLRILIRKEIEREPTDKEIESILREVSMDEPFAATWLRYHGFEELARKQERADRNVYKYRAKYDGDRGRESDTYLAEFLGIDTDETEYMSLFEASDASDIILFEIMALDNGILSKLEFITLL